MDSNTLQTLKRVYVEAEGMASGSGAEPDAILRETEGAWHPGDIRRLAKLAEIAATMGDMSTEVARTTGRLAMRTRAGRFVDLAAAGRWAAALRWAIDDLASNAWFGTPPGSTTRGLEVGAAAVRLRKAGYAVTVDGNGCQIAEGRRRELLRRVDRLVRQLGGVEVLLQLFRILDEQGRHQDGMWLLGDIVPTVGTRKEPTLPYGWLYTLALKHVRPVARKRKPEVAWGNLVALSRDYAALVDVERYDSMQRMDVYAGELIPTLVEALGWHQLFTFPRYRKPVVLALVRAMRDVLDEAQWTAFGVSAPVLEAELRTFFSLTAAKGPSTVPGDVARRIVPNLLRIAAVPEGGANRKFVDPFDAEERTADGSLLFEYGDAYLVLPDAVAAAQAATMLVMRMWATLGDEPAKKAVGAVCEHVVGSVCGASATAHVATDLVYHVAKQRFQIDVMVTEGDEVAVLEVKAKALTKLALSGDLTKYLSDYDTSYLAMLKQLVRHETHLRTGNPDLPPIAAGSKVSKVAVSPLTYGPLSDAHLGRSIFLALLRSKLGLFEPDAGKLKVIADLEKDVRSVGRSLETFIGDGPDDHRDMRVALMSYHWLDLAQLDAVVRLKGATSAALKMLRHASFSSHDIWHEVALRQRLDGAAATS